MDRGEGGLSEGGCGRKGEMWAGVEVTMEAEGGEQQQVERHVPH